MTKPCFSFFDTLSVPGVTIPPYMAYGIIPPLDCDCSPCKKSWGPSQRREWYDAICAAQEAIEDVLKWPICATEICNERHRVDCPIQLDYRPVAYLGKMVYGPRRKYRVHFDYKTLPSSCHKCAVSRSICPENYRAWAVIKKEDFPDWVCADDLFFDYPDPSDYVHRMPFPLAHPYSIKEIKGDNGQVSCWLAVWPKYMLAHPLLAHNSEISDNDVFMCEISVGWKKIDASSGIVPERTCAKCQPCYGSPFGCEPCTPSPITGTIADHIAGTVCLKRNDGCGCSCKSEYVYVNYAYGGECDPRCSLREAVVKLAVSKLMKNDRICPCSDWEKILEYWLQPDTFAKTMHESRAKWGGSMAAMQAYRIVDTIPGPHKFSKQSGTGGLLVAREKSKGGITW